MMMLENMEQETAALPMAERVAWANDLAAQIDSALDRAWHTAAVLGFVLLKMKEYMPHGGFGKLFEGGAGGFSFARMTANRYMKLARLCMAQAGKVGKEEALAALFSQAAALPAPEGGGGGTGLAVCGQEAGNALSCALQELAPAARSMRQAMFYFMEDPAARKTPEDVLPALRELNELMGRERAGGRRTPGFSVPNREGQKRKPKDLDAERRDADKVIHAVTLDLGKLISGGRHVQCSPDVRAAACLAMEQALQAFRAVK